MKSKILPKQTGNFQPVAGYPASNTRHRKGIQILFLAGCFMGAVLLQGISLYAQVQPVPRQPRTTLQDTLKKGLYKKIVEFKSENAPVFSRDRVYLRTEDGKLISSPGKIIREQKDKLGQSHYRSQQMINGFAVENAIYLQHVVNGKVILANGDWIKDLPVHLAAKPSLSRDVALNKALQKTGAATYMWQVPAEETMLKEETNNPKATYYPTAELVYYSGEKQVDTSNLRLAYKFDIYAHNPLSRQYVFIDALNGKVLGVRQRIYHARIPATATTGYSGSQTIITDSVDGLYRLRDSSRGKGIITRNMKASTSGSGVDFTNGTTTWNNANQQLDQYATDAHWGAEKTYDYFYNHFGRNSLDGSGMTLHSRVHYGNQYFNAFWDGSRVTYGDGYSRPLTSLDICGHEMAHGLTEFTSGLIYFDESGALNEGFSDIFGTSIENYARPDNWNWKIGSEIETFRDMSNPNSYLHPDTYKGDHWYTIDPNGGFWNEQQQMFVHTNSGVLNFWFYLLTVGGIGTNDNGCAYNVNGIGMLKAAAIAYRTNVIYLSPGSDYADALTFSLRAANDLYGAGSNEVAQTINAWAAVGLTLDPTPPTLSASLSSICFGENTILSVTAGDASQWKWYTNSCGGILVGTGTSITVSPGDTTTYYVRGEGNCDTVFGECNSITIIVKPRPAKPIVTADGPLSFCEADSVILTAPPGLDTYSWSNGATGNPLTARTSGLYSVRVADNNGCTSTSSDTMFVTVYPVPPRPVIVPGGPTTFCEGGSVILTAPAGFPAYRWTHGPTTQSITVSTGNSFQVAVADSYGCRSAPSEPLIISVKPLPPKPLITPGGSTTFCAGESVALSVSPGFVGYTWSNGANTPSINVSAGGSYAVMVSDDNGCHSPSSDSVAVTVNPLPPAPAISGTTEYQGSANVILTAANCSGTLVWTGPGNVSGTGNIPVSTAVAGSFTYTVACQANNCTGPATSVTVKVISALTVSHLNGDNTQPFNNIIRPYLQLNNEGITPVPYGEIKIRYWLTAENFSPLTNLDVNYAQLGSNKVSMRYVKLPQPLQGAFGYVEYSFDPSAGTLAASNNSGPIQSGIAKQDWTVFNETDDYSFASHTSYIKTDRITVYRNGILAGGVEPSTVAPLKILKMFSQNTNKKTNSNTISTFLKLGNEGNLAVAYKDLTVRYWFTAEGNQPLNYYMDYSPLGSSNIKGKFVKPATTLPGADTYLELSFPTLTDSLYPLSNTGNIQQRIAKSNWSAFNETNDHSFKAEAPMAENNRITVYLNGQLVYGMEPAVSNGITSMGVASPGVASTSTGSPADIRSVKIGPVPASSVLYVQLTGYAGNVTIQLQNLEGKILKQQKVRAPAGKYAQQQMNVADITPGIYFLTIIDEKGKRQTEKLIISR